MNHRRTIRQSTMRLGGSPASVFPLLCPVRESEWIETWRCRMVYSDSGHAERDCIFQTEFPQDGPLDTWVVSRYEPPSLIEFVRVNAHRAIRYAITLRAAAGGGTEAEWRQVLTGLDAEGDAFVEGLAEGEFPRRMAALERMLNHFLATGRMLHVGGSSGEGVTPEGSR
jgi:hypothetical protein